MQHIAALPLCHVGIDQTEHSGQVSAYLGVSVHKNHSSLQQRCKVGRGQQLGVLAHQSEGLKASL